MATATPLGPPGPDGGEAARRVAQAGRATKARLAPLAVTHRYNRTHCLWLEQFQIAESMRPLGVRISQIAERRFPGSGALGCLFDRGAWRRSGDCGVRAACPPSWQ